MSGKKLKKILISFIIVLIIILFILIYMSKNKSEADTTIENIGSTEINITEKSVTIENFDEIVDNLPMKSITMHNRIQDFCLEFLEDIYNNLKNSSEEEIEQYYITNENEIKNYIYNSNLERFQNIVAKLKEINTDKLIYSGNIFDIDSFTETENEITFNMKVTYNELYSIDFKVYANKENEIIEENQIFFDLMNE